MEPKQKVWKPPKTLALAADKLYTIRRQRLDKEAEAKILKAEETALKEHLIKNLPKGDATGIAGKLARVTIGVDPTPQVDDWPKLYEYIVKNYKKNPGVFALLQRRVGESAVKEAWEAGDTIPGVGVFNVPVVHINKV